MILKYKDNIIGATRRVDPTVIDLVTNETWQRIKLHGVPLARYLTVSSAGLDKLRDELESENDGLKIPLTIRWLGKAEDIAARWRQGLVNASSVTFAVKGEGIAERIVQNGTRARGTRMRASYFVAAGPRALCTTCSGWVTLRRDVRFPGADARGVQEDIRRGSMHAWCRGATSPEAYPILTRFSTAWELIRRFQRIAQPREKPWKELGKLG